APSASRYLLEQLRVLGQQVLDLPVDLDPHLLLDLDVEIDHDRILGCLHLHPVRARREREEDQDGRQGTTGQSPASAGGWPRESGSWRGWLGGWRRARLRG